MPTGVYIIRNKINDKVYVGSSSSCVDGRWYHHKYGLRLGKHKSRHLQSAWNKYGEPNFEFVFVRACKAKDCIKFEQKYIDKYKSYLREFGYNTNRIADSSFGVKRSEETKKKLAKSVKEWMNRPEERLKNSIRTKEAMNRPEVKAKIIKARNSPTAKARRAELLNDPKYKAKHRKAMKKAMNDPEIRKRKSEAALKMWSDPKVRMARAAKMKEVWQREGVKKKHSASLKRAWARSPLVVFTPELRKKLSEAQLRRFKRERAIKAGQSK